MLMRVLANGRLHAMGEASLKADEGCEKKLIKYTIKHDQSLKTVSQNFAF